MITKKDFFSLSGMLILSAIAKYSGKRKAAEMLNVSVDTINKYMEHLEAELGIKLLSSNGRGSNLTPEAKKILEHAQKIEDEYQQIYEVKPDNKNLIGEVKIGTNVGVRSNLLPKNLGAFFDSYPNIRLTSVALSGDFSLSENGLDIGLSYSEPSGSDVVIMHTKVVRCGFFASPEFLGMYGYPVDLQDMLENYRIVNKINSQMRSKMWKDVLKNAKKLCYQTNTSFSLVEAVYNGVGIGLLPMHFKGEGMVCLDNIATDATLTFHLYADRKTKDIPRIRVVINYYKSLLDLM